MNIIGIIQEIRDKENLPNNFVKRELWLYKSDPKYPQTIPFEFTQTRADLLETFSIGQEVNISFDIRGRIWNSKCFVSLNGYDIKLTPRSTETMVGKFDEWREKKDKADGLPF
jgi:hypothetical protein